MELSASRRADEWILQGSIDAERAALNRRLVDGIRLARRAAKPLLHGARICSHDALIGTIRYVADAVGCTGSGAETSKDQHVNDICRLHDKACRQRR
jgi:hypothetical protein